MSRRNRVGPRVIAPDANYNNVIVSKMINRIMLSGKKSTAEKQAAAKGSASKGSTVKKQGTAKASGTKTTTKKTTAGKGATKGTKKK